MDTRIGGPDPDDAEPEPEPPEAWEAAGYGSEDAALWRHWRFSVRRADDWRAQGVEGALVAARWRAAGVRPDQVRAWLGAGIEAGEAVHWHEMGFSVDEARVAKRRGQRPADAFAARNPPTPHRIISRSFVGRQFVMGADFRRFQESGIDPRVIQTYLQRQWVDGDAKAWATQGIEALDAYLWHDLGLTAAEAGRLHAQGRTPGDVIREWWASGVPFDEVAAWIGAGLTADEAAAQRARGITVEHAAALRALRQHDESPPMTANRRTNDLLSRTGPPGAQRPGPPPEHEETARTQIVTAYAEMLTPGEDPSSVPAVDGGENLGDCIHEARRRHLDHQAGAETSTTVTVDGIRFVNATEARVAFSIVVSGGPTLTLGDRIGRAVLVGGVWKVARETFCEFMALAGLECPPRVE